MSAVKIEGFCSGGSFVVVGVACGIGGAEVGLGFDDTEDELITCWEVTDEVSSEKVFGDFLGGIAKGKGFQGCERGFWGILGCFQVCIMELKGLKKTLIVINGRKMHNFVLCRRILGCMLCSRG